jgi:DNA-binding SARP family transcriptional activator/formylglycine-generating enzyme required for sulfatase activity/dienelactone hydrolase
MLAQTGSAPVCWLAPINQAFRRSQRAVNSAKPFSIRLLGTPCVVGVDGIQVTGRPVQRHRLALLALLALAGERGSTRDRLLGLLWPESDAEHARQLLNQAVYQLRKALGEDAILSAGDELRLNAAVLRVDLAEFERALAEGDAAGATAIYRGPFLDGFFQRDSVELEQRIERERQRLAMLYGQALERVAEAAETKRDFAGAVDAWQGRAAHDPYDSRVALRLMQALEAGGNRAGALQHAAAHGRLLQDELGIAPPTEVLAFARRLRADASAVTPAPTPPAPPPPMPPVVDDAPSAPERPSPVSSSPPAAHARTRGFVRSRNAFAAVAVVTLGASAFWLANRNDDAHWLLRAALPQIEDFLSAADWESAFRLVREAERRVPNSPEIAELWPRVSWRVAIASEPAGAMVYRQAYLAPNDEWEMLGRTPMQNIRIPYGLSRLRFELPGHQPLFRALGGAHINWQELKPADPDVLLVGPYSFRLDTEASLPSDMIRVPGWFVRLDGDRIAVGDFFLGRYEVTNAEYRAFVIAGGYQRPELWDPVVVNGVSIPWRDAMTRFVDRTGRPGPSTWEAGDYPQGDDQLPVSGVSWYEATAYARFAGRELPTAHHWQHALANAMFPWLLPASNFGGAGPRRVTESRAMSHVGAYDMAGNVREWTSTAIGDERITLGGSWNDPYYIAGTEDTSAPPTDRSPGNGIRLAIMRDEPRAASRLRAPMRSRTTTAPDVVREPVADAVFAAYSRVFDYDRRPLEATVDDVDTTRVWIRERISFAAGYGTERVELYLYVPRHVRPPYQTVVYWPGWDTFGLDDVDEYFAKQLDFAVKSGRAVAFPIYRGTFGRTVGGVRTRPRFGSAEYRDNTIYTVKDLRRTIDYLETRSDIAHDALAYFGYSWGGVNGPVALAQEPRMRAAIIQIGLLPPMAATPEVDPVNSLPRVRVPTLLFSGEFDPMVPRGNSERYFALLGTTSSQKRHVIAIGGHFIPRPLVIRETLEWLDRHLGPVRR